MMNKKMNFFAMLITSLLSLNCFGMEQEPGAGQPAVQLPESITIETNDDHQHVVPINLYRLSGTIRNMVEDMGESATAAPIPLPQISSDIWNLLVPLLQLQHVQSGIFLCSRYYTAQREAINKALQHLSLPELSRIICAANYLDIPMLIDCIADEIAHRLVAAECKTEFKGNATFLCNAGLCCQPNCTHGEDTKSLPNQLSKLIGRKTMERSAAIRAHVLQNAFNCIILSGYNDYTKSVHVAGNRIVSRSTDNVIRIFDINNGRCLHKLSLPGHRVCVSENRIISTFENTIHIWDINNGQHLHSLQGHNTMIISLCVAGDKIISGSFDNTIRIWNINTGQCLHILQGYGGLVIVAGNRILYAFGGGETIRIWDINTGQSLPSVQGGLDDLNDEFVGVANDRIVYIYEGGIHIRDTNTGLYLHTQMHNLQGQGCLFFPRTVVCVKDDRIISASEDRTIRIWNMESGECLRTIPSNPGESCLVRVADNRIVSGSTNGTIRIRDINTGQCLVAFRPHTSAITSMHLAGDRIVSESHDRTIGIWDIAQFNACFHYLQEDITIEQAMLLLCAHDTMQANTPLDLTNRPRLMAIYDSINCPTIRDILVRTNMIYTGQLARYLWTNRRLNIATATLSAAAIAGWTLWRIWRRRN